MTAGTAVRQTVSEEEGLLRALEDSFEKTVKVSLLRQVATLPVIIERTIEDIFAWEWASSYRDRVETVVRRYGAVLFRNFGLDTVAQFERFAEALSPGLYGSYGDLPKKEGGRNVYRSTPYPEREMILFHNESSHLESWPRKQLFFCELPSPIGGATPLVDIREMLARLPVPVVDKFERKGLIYVRTFTGNLDVSWQEFFKTNDRGLVEERCRSLGTGFSWLDGDALQMRTFCPAVIRHPITQDRAFFNQIQLHHPYCLGEEVREDLIDVFGLDRLPRTVTYGDGEPIEDEVMSIVGSTYEECAVRFDWRKGDVVMLDNMLTAHARDPYQGPRQIAVAMGDMTRRTDIWSAGDASEHAVQSRS